MDKPLELLMSDTQDAPQSEEHVVFAMPFPINALLIDAQKEFLPQLEANLTRCINLNWEKTSDLSGIKTSKSSGKPFNLILLVIPHDDQLAQQALKCASSYGADIIILGQDTPQSVLRLAFQHGVSDFIPLDAPDIELFQALKKIALQLSEKTELASVLVVVNGKGGSGASFIASSLAVIAADRDDKDVALLDTDLHYGSLAHILGFEPTYFISDALQALGDMDEVALKSAMTSRGKLHLLAAAPFSMLNSYEDIKLGNIYDLLWKCRQHYNQVIVDLSRGPENWNGELLRNADILIVTQQNLMIVRETKALVQQLMTNMGIAKDKIHLVVNRYDKSNTAIKLIDIQNAVGIESIFVIANDYKLASECADLGKPITKVAKRQRMLQDLKLITERFLPAKDSSKKTTGFWARILGK
ncbi:P-loop NTPase [Shewanella sp. AS16]|uniref:AAA family ATPase n=1 Tax=Shewanella sp. AS16 TaxID=2907625 RepID=UPI001F26C09D|nr:P-loop NTPase [Shewanella sp. AS16]MCE9685375.1 P-loop NTPase [Shewanella sp. AS16]